TPLPPASAGEVRETLPASPRAAIPEITGGILQLVIIPFGEVTVGDRQLGRISSQKVPLPTGSHPVVIVHPDYQPLRRRVTIIEGETLKLVVDLSEEGVRRRK